LAFDAAMRARGKAALLIRDIPNYFCIKENAAPGLLVTTVGNLIADS
jgi:hypothetical protein